MITKKDLRDVLEFVNGVEFLALNKTKRTSLIRLMNSKKPSEKVYPEYGIELSQKDLETFILAKPEGVKHDIENSDIISYQYFTKGKPKVEIRIFSTKTNTNETNRANICEN